MMRNGISAGFSLIELIVVVALIAIMATMAAPMWQDYRANTDLKSAARGVMADIADAKQRAVSENSDAYKLEFDVSGNAYALTWKGATQWTKPLTSYGSGIVLNSVSFFGGTDITLRNRGTVTNGDLILSNGLGSTATITVNITGRTHVQYTMS